MKLVGERRALAAVVFAFYFILYFALAAQGVQPPLTNALYGLAGVYALAFFSLVAGYFWARWYAVGVGLYGVITGAVGLWQMGPEPIVLFIGGTHLFATLALWGSGMAELYDGQTKWREKLHMDESAVQRLGRSVIRAGVSLPMVLLYALAPKPGAAELALSATALLLAGLGLRAMVRMRTWGVFAVGTAGALMVTLAGVGAIGHASDMMVLKPMLGGALLLSAAAPWAAPIFKFFR